MDWRGPEIILKFGVGHTSEIDKYHNYRLQITLWVLETRLGVFSTLEIFRYQKVRVKSMPIPNYGVSKTILNPFDIFVGGRNWTADCCKDRLNHAIFMKE